MRHGGRGANYYKKTGLILAMCGAFMLFLGGTGAVHGQPAENGGKRQLYFFYSPTCKECADARMKILPSLRELFGGKVSVVERDISLPEEYKFYLSLRRQHHDALRNDHWPVFFLEGEFLSGDDAESPESFVRRVMQDGAAAVKTGSGAAAADIKNNFAGLGLLAVVSAGLVDGINPCAFTVIVFFISFLALQGYSRKELVFVGTIFILAVFCAYVMIGLGIFGFLYKLNRFWQVANSINLVFGIVSLALGAAAVYDIVVFYFRGGGDKMVLRLPSAVKARIQGVIGDTYRRGKDRQRLSLRAHALTAFSTGFLVSLLESVCTGQLYLPTIVFVLKTAEFKAKACFYLFIYNIMFILPLAAVLTVALLGVTSARMASFVGRKIPVLKAAMAAVFFIMGFLLIRRS